MPIPMPTPAATAATVVDAIRAVDASFIVPAPLVFGYQIIIWLF